MQTGPFWRKRGGAGRPALVIALACSRCHISHQTYKLAVQRACAAAEAKPSTEVVILVDDDTFTSVKVKSSSGTGGDMLMAISGVFNMFDISVLEASISSGEDGELYDIFHVATPDSKPVRSHVLRQAASG